MKDLKNFATEQFPWKGSSDDFICELGEYVLRVEQMDFGKWWWRVYWKGEPIFVDREFTQSKFRAIGLAEGLYLGHSPLYPES